MPKQHALTELREAMIRHGNVEGIETQLRDAEDFLYLAFDMLIPVQQSEFLGNSIVTEFIDDNSPSPDDRCVCGHRRGEHRFGTPEGCGAPDCDCAEWCPA